jgi:serine/threonine protein kinase
MGLPVDNAVPVCMKTSTNLEAISREYENYRKLSFLGITRTGRFVRCYEFFPVAGYDKQFRNKCALAIEQGTQDLKSFLNSKGRLEGKDLRDACIAATQCVQALHNAGLVWTDMKTENFVVMANGEVKGIDLESAMPIGDNPVDYSPEACPPEFATAFLAGEGPYFELDTSYDIWSLGMLMLELATGGGYFDGKNPAQITKFLRDMEDGSGIDVEGFDIDDRLKDLIGRCLQKDSRKRLNTAQILLHPYFLAGNPFSFLS